MADGVLGGFDPSSIEKLEKKTPISVETGSQSKLGVENHKDENTSPKNKLLSSQTEKTIPVIEDPSITSQKIQAVKDDLEFFLSTKPIITITFHGTYSGENKLRFFTTQEADLKRIYQYLMTDPKVLQGMRHEVFDSREGKQQADPNHSISRASARFQEFTLYRYWIPTDDPSFPHELTHLVAHRWTTPYQWTTILDTADGQQIEKTLDMVSTSFMQEGLAIAIDDIVFGKGLLEEGEVKPIDDWCREQTADMPTSLVSVINMAGFSSMQNKVVVPFSASFSKFLLQVYGVERYKQMYTQLKETNTPEENVGILEHVYGLSEKELLASWEICYEKGR